ncbi:MAG: 2OG-Fe(II) oxygenase [Pseudomonadota bacterium]
MFNLEGFLTPSALDTSLDLIRPRLATEAFTHARRHNIYFEPSIPGIPKDHPALMQTETVNRTLCADQLCDTPVLQAYVYPPLGKFLSEIMGLSMLYPMDDPLAALNVMGYGSGEALNWHFDRSQFTTTLLLQASDAGGAFEYRPDLRSDDDPNFDGVARLLAGEDDTVRTLSMYPGTLNVSLGKNTAHRVTPVQGERQRIVAVFSYYDRPGVRFSPAEQRGFYGRVA